MGKTKAKKEAEVKEKEEVKPIPLFLAKDPDHVSYLKFALYAWHEPEKLENYQTIDTHTNPVGLTMYKVLGGPVKGKQPDVTQVCLYGNYKDNDKAGWLFASARKDGSMTITGDGGYKFDELEHHILKFIQFCTDFGIKYTRGSF